MRFVIPANLKMEQMGDEVDAWQAVFNGQLLPLLDKSLYAGKLMRTIYDKDRTPIHPHMTFIQKSFPQCHEVPPVVFRPRIVMLDQNFVRRPMPDARPALVRPAKTKRKIRFARSDHFVEGPF